MLIKVIAALCAILILGVACWKGIPPPSYFKHREKDSDDL